ncbi:MAG: AAA family ATPase, partial [Proteobacteria bacterium]|nr:AAA family ATPase [Pseudomonadota bacterium]
MARDVERWLEGLGLGKYTEAFAENDIGADVLPYLTEEHLKELGVSLGDRVRLLKAIEALAATPAEAAEASPPSEPAASVAAPVGEAERRQLTVMFCDLVGSTELSTRFDPEDLRELIRTYQAACAKVIARYNGYIAKYMGDGVLVYFGYPQAHENDAERAVRTGLGIVEAMAGLGAAHASLGEVELAVRVGIDTGLVVVGDLVGEGASEEASVVGETPNVAARLQGLAQPNQVLIGALTHELIGADFDCEDLGAHHLKGIAEPVPAWRVLGEGDIDSRYEAKRVGAGLPLVGRQEELGLLLRSWEATKETHGQVVLIQGEAGIGKSRLVEALRERVSEQDYIWIAARCSPYHANSTLYPVIEHLKRVMGWTPEDGAEAKLEKLEAALEGQSLPPEEAVPLYAELMSLALPEGRYAPLELSAKQKREQTLDALAGWLLEMAERTPVLQVWEDLHWADPTTLELLALYIEQSPTVSMMNVLIYRPEFVPPWTMRSHMTPITLNRLERPEVEALIGHQANGKQVPSEVVEHIVGKTDGVPLFVEELTKAILEADFLRERDGRYELTGPLSGMTIPATLQDSLMARLDRLPNIREVAQLGAVLGREFAYEMVQAIGSIEETTLQEGLGQLVDAELLYQRGRPPRAKYIFKHALVQDAAYDSLLLSHRRLLHGNVVTTIEQLFRGNLDDHAELLAFHAQRGELWEKALDFCLLAGRKANERSAYDEALSFLETGLKVAERVPENEDTLRTVIDIRLSMRPSLGAFGRYNHFLDVLSEAESAAQRLGDKYTTAHISVEKTHVLYQTGNVSDGVELGRKAVEMARDIDHRRLIVGAAANLGMALFFRGDLREAVRVAIEHVDDLQNEFRHDQLGTTGTSSVNWLANLAAMHAMLGKLDTAKRFGEEAARIAEETDKPFDIAMAGHWNGFVSISMDDLPNAFQCLERAFQLVEDHGLNFLYPFGGMHLGTACALSGQHERAETLLMSAADKADQLGLVLANIWAVALLAAAKIL